MDEYELRMQKQILPYSDCSGYRMKLEVIRTSEGASIRVHQHDSYVEIGSFDWREVRDAIERMLDYMSDEPQSNGDRTNDEPEAGDGLNQTSLPESESH